MNFWLGLMVLNTNPCPKLLNIIHCITLVTLESFIFQTFLLQLLRDSHLCKLLHLMLFALKKIIPCIPGIIFFNAKNIESTRVYFPPPVGGGESFLHSHSNYCIWCPCYQVLSLYVTLNIFQPQVAMSGVNSTDFTSCSNNFYEVEGLVFCLFVFLWSVKLIHFVLSYKDPRSVFPSQWLLVALIMGKRLFPRHSASLFQSTESYDPLKYSEIIRYSFISLPIPVIQDGFDL